MTLAIVAVVFLVLIGACGGIAWYVTKSFKKTVDNMAVQIDSTAEAEEFLLKLSGDRVQAAYDSTSPTFKTSMTFDQFQKLIAKNPLLTAHTDARPLTSKEPTGKTPNRRQSIGYELTEVDDEDDEFEPAPKRKKKGAATGPKSLTVTVTLAEQAGGFWKVDGLTVP